MDISSRAEDAQGTPRWRWSSGQVEKSLGFRAEVHWVGILDNVKRYFLDLILFLAAKSGSERTSVSSISNSLRAPFSQHPAEIAPCGAYPSWAAPAVHFYEARMTELLPRRKKHDRFRC